MRLGCEEESGEDIVPYAPWYSYYVDREQAQRDGDGREVEEEELPQRPPWTQHIEDLWFFAVCLLLLLLDSRLVWLVLLFVPLLVARPLNGLVLPVVALQQFILGVHQSSSSRYLGGRHHQPGFNSHYNITNPFSALSVRNCWRTQWVVRL